MAARNPFSMYGRLAKPLQPVHGKTFVLVPATSNLIPGLMDEFPVDESGLPRVFTDAAMALAACVNGRGDRVYALPGTYTISTGLASAITDWSLVGLGGPGAAMFTGSAAHILTLTGSNVEIANVGFTIASTKTAIIMTGASYCNIHDCLFLSGVGGTTSWFINMLTTACNYNVIRDNRFISNLVVAGGAITQTGHVSLLGIGNLIEKNVFVAGRATTANAGAVTDGVLSNAAADSGNTIRLNTFYESNGATFTAGVESGASSVSGSILPVANNFLLATAANAIVNTTGSAGFANNVANGTV